jgi:RNA polymerase sigma-70 factor (ECF subfamily)
MGPSTSISTTNRAAEPAAAKTDWAMIHLAVHGGTLSRDAWEQLARRYWPAIYAYLRTTGRRPDEAADLTQGFVCDVLLARSLVQSADPRRGRFRTLLLTALRNYVKERHRYERRERRWPRTATSAPAVSLDDGATETAARPGDVDPETAFAAHWSTALVHRVLDAVRDECVSEELGAHWCVFERRVVRPLLFGEPPVPYAVLVEQFDLKDAAQATNMMITVKRRFARALYAEVGRTVQNPEDVGDEILELLRALERPR